MAVFQISTFFRLSLLGIFASISNLVVAQSSQHLADGWEYQQGSLGSTWEIWRGEAASDSVTWTVSRAIDSPPRFSI